LDKQLEIIQPEVVVLLGRVAALAVLGLDIEISKEHGKILEENGRKYFVSYHPAAPLHNPNRRADLLKDFKKLKKYI
jgi:DNA polymerase